MKLNCLRVCVCYVAVVLAIAGATVQAAPQRVAAQQGATPQWEQSGWGGGGFYWAAAFHPKKDGVIYMAGDVLGVYKTVDHGLHWRIINNGLINYAVYSLAVDRRNPDTVYAATEGGLYKSTDAGENWELLPRTGRNELRITGERGLSIRCIAVDPTNSNIVYAGSPLGKIYKSLNGGQDWAIVYESKKESSGTSRTSNISSVIVSPKNPSMVLAVSPAAGLLITRDAGSTWNTISTPAPTSSATFDPANPRVIYAGFGNKGIGKSTDGGVTWTTSSDGFAKDLTIREIVVSPANSQEVYAIGAVGWSGYFYASRDGGKSWTNASTLATDPIGNPTLPAEGKTVPMSNVTNLAINPSNPKELFISGNWRPCWSQDAGRTWEERVHGADISVITDVRFSDNRVYATAMDEGTLVSENNGQLWRQLWPLKWNQEISGHNWRLAITKQNGVDRIISTVSPWDKYPPRTVLSEDGGNTVKIITSGLPDYIIKPNTMWGVGHPRALAVDPQNPQIVYLGIDGDPAEGKSGGGIFKSQDGGVSWKQLPAQPGSRRMFYGLQVDPTDSKRIYWAALGTEGGVYRSEDSGESWMQVFSTEGWPFNLMVSRDGTAYCAGKYLWRSTDHGTTWTKITDFSPGGTIMGLEQDPRDNKTLWITFDGGKGGVYKTTDRGATWKEITGNLPYIYPQILRFNPATNELWTAGVGLFKIKQ